MSSLGRYAFPSILVDPFARTIDRFPNSLDLFARTFDLLLSRIGRFPDPIDLFTRRIDRFARTFDGFARQIGLFGGSIYRLHPPPNNALQRTGTGGGVFPAFHA